jgi:hypothetical protein
MCRNCAEDVDDCGNSKMQVGRNLKHNEYPTSQVLWFNKIYG